MARSKQKPSTGLTVPVEQVARLVDSFDRRQKARLLQLVPELQVIRLEEAGIPPSQEELLTFFEHRLDRLAERRIMQDSDPFLGGLTVSEFFARSEDEQSRIWTQAHVEAEREWASQEQSVGANALPAR